MTKHFTLITGGSGGHVFPAVSLYEELQSQGYRASIIVDQRGKRYIPDTIKNATEIPIYRLFPPFGKLFYPFSLMIALLRCILLFIINRPKAVVGFGGYTTIPGIAAAKILFIPIILHEGNSFLGQANRFLQPWAKKIALSFKKTDFAHHEDATLTGLPLRKLISDNIAKYIPPSEEKMLNILVIGGSQGAGIFARLIPDAVRTLPKYKQKRLNIRHQCRIEMVEIANTAYEDLECTVDMQPFFDDMPKEYNQAHLVISRSGSSSLFELAAFKMPSILIPFAASAEGDQAKNAAQFDEKGACWLFSEREVNTAQIGAILSEALDSPDILLQKSKSMAKMHIANSSKKLAQLVVSI
ncbi:MAG: hypothetical protein COY39_04855 [Alphaproteobacteria bacterium CG_4_10_14_0_8_um_filter_37_21]|nr:MAG: hypothetical protein COY39_04855 [Alphaproteobacteria bacterium CG_4_10_14_0_8_um_filter_37_21]